MSSSVFGKKYDLMLRLNGSEDPVQPFFFFYVTQIGLCFSTLTSLICLSKDAYVTSVTGLNWEVEDWFCVLRLAHMLAQWFASRT